MLGAFDDAVGRTVLPSARVSRKGACGPGRRQDRPPHGLALVLLLVSRFSRSGFAVKLSFSTMKEKIRSTTVICVRRDGHVVMAGDGQVTLGHEVLKASAKKLRRLYNDKILAGFAGSTADAFSLFARFETKLEQFNGNLSRSVVELAKDWRTDKILRHLEALLLVADTKNTYIVSGNGDVIEPDEGVASIGSGGPFATAAATALLHHTKMTARQVVEEAMSIAGKICIYTNDNVSYEELG